MKAHFKRLGMLLAFLVVVGVSVDGSGLVDCAILLVLYAVGEAIFMLKVLVSRPGDPKSHLRGGELALLPEGWR